MYWNVCTWSSCCCFRHWDSKVYCRRTRNCRTFYNIFWAGTEASHDCLVYSVALYYEFSLLHIFIGSSALNVSMYSENRRGIYFSPQKRLKHGRQNIRFHWINGIIRDNKCIFTKLNAVFKLKTVVWTKKIFFSSIKNYPLPWNRIWGPNKTVQ